MGRFLFLAIFFVIATGLVLQFRFEIPYLTGWIGTLPGDMVIKKGDITIYLPLATSAIMSAGISFLLSLFSKN